MRRLAVLVLLSLSFGCMPQLGTVDRLGKAQQWVAWVDTLRQSHPEQLRIYAQVEQQLVAVRDTSNWPDAGVTYNLWLDPDGRPVLHAEIPFSESGDWHVVYTHYFDEQGRTVAFDSEAAWFNSMCTEVLRRHIRILFDEGFRLLKADTSHADAEGRPINPKKSQCGNPYDFSATPYATYAALVRAAKAPSSVE
jgi:hypothetical protein